MNLKLLRKVSTGEQVAVLTADIISAYVKHHRTHAQDLVKLIEDTGLALSEILTHRPEPERQLPAVPVSRTVTEDYIVCLEDGKRFRDLTRHLRSAHGLSPEDYRAKWGLPANYPLAVPRNSRKLPSRRDATAADAKR